MSKLARIALLSTAVASTGCSRTVYAPASELPGLAPINMARSDEWPTVRTQGGDTHTLAGPIESIQLTHPRGVDPLASDFNAGIVGDNLSIIDGRGPRVYSLATKPYLTINYTDRKAGYIIGGSALITGGLAVGVLGVVTLVEGADLIDSGDIFSGFIGVFVSLFGVAVAGTGVGLTVGGIVVATRTPEKPTQTSFVTAPKLRFGPNGAGFSVKF